MDVEYRKLRVGLVLVSKNLFELGVIRIEDPDMRTHKATDHAEWWIHIVINPTEN
jgi:hypothetical protein